MATTTTTTSKDKTFYLRQMSSICVDHSSLKARVAHTFFHGSYCNTSYEKFLLTLEYLQLLSPILLTAAFLEKDQETFIFRTVLFISRLINPAYWVSVSKLSDLKIFIIVILFAFLALKALVPGWIAYRLHKKASIPPAIIKVWRNIFKAYGRMIYFYVTTLLVNTIMKAKLDTTQTEDNRNKAMVIIFIFFTAGDFIMTLVFTSRYLYVLPAKNFLSAKDNIVEVITLCQKFIVQMLIVFVDFDSLGGFWTFTVVNLLADLFRDFYFYKTLPLYNFKALAYQGRLLTGVTSINIACFVCAIVKSIDENTASLQLVIVLWILLCIFNLKLSEESLQRSFWMVVAYPGVKNPYLLAHRISAIKQLRELTQESASSHGRSDWTFLANKTLNENLKSTLKLDSSFKGVKDINCRESTTMMFKLYLEKLIEIYPKNHLIQLLMARFNVKKFNLYGEAIRIAKNVVKNGSNQMALNAELLLIEIQSIIYSKSSKENNPDIQVDPLGYIQQQSILAQIKLSMLEQAKIQIKICEQVKKDSPDLAFISDNSQTLNDLKNKIRKKMKKFVQEISEGNLEPLLLYAQYHIALNHSFCEYVRFLDQYIQKNQRCQKYFTQEALTKKNMFQNNTGFYFVSGQRSDPGNIIFNTIPRTSAFGSHFLQAGTNLAERAPPCLRAAYAALYKSLSEDASYIYLNKVIRAFSYIREDDHLVEIEYNLSIHPYATQGFYFLLMFRQVETTRESMYVHENGDIEAATENIKKKLNMIRHHSEGHKPIYNIKDLSEELVLANQIFNQIALPKKYNAKEESDEIYSVFSTSGKDLLLKRFHQESETYSYNVKIANKPFGTLLLKVFTFEENIRENGNKGLNRYQSTVDSKNYETLALDKVIATQPSYECLAGDDEKGAGWINVEALNSRKTAMMATRREATMGETGRDEDNTTHRFLIGSPLLKESADDNFKNSSQRKSQAKRSTNLVSDSRSNTDAKEKEDNLNEGENSFILSMNNSSTYSQRKRMTSIYKTALNAKYYPKLFKVAAALFILMLLFFIASEVIFLTTVDSNIQELKVKKDVLRNFQLRNYNSVCLEGFVRIMWELMTGSLSLADIQNFPPTVLVYYLFTNQMLNGLLNANNNLQIDASGLNDDLKGLIFKQDIPIYSTYFGESPQEYINLNTLQAMDRILETGFSIMNNGFAQTPEIREQSLFIFRNSLNDLILKNQIITDKLKDTLTSQRNLIENNITVYIIAKSLVLGFVLMISLFILWRIYLKEEFNLSAFCHINGNKLDFALRGFTEFKTSIEEQTTFAHDFRFLLARNDEDKRAAAVKTEFLKVANTQGIQRRYLISAIKYFVVIAVFTALMVVTSKIAKSNIKSFKDEQDQIYLIDLLKTKTTFLTAASRELLVTNNTVYIENTLVADRYAALLDEYSDIRVSVFSMLTDEGIVDSSQMLHDFLLGDSCPYYTSPLAPLQCNFIKANGMKTNFIDLMTSFENTLRDQLSDYLNSDKSAAAIAQIKKDKISIILASFSLLVSVEENVAYLIDIELDKEIEESHSDRVDAFIAWMVVIVVVGVLGWWMILRKMMNGVNNFKNVLKVLPGEVICSSFILKTFLIKTTHKGLGVDLNKI